MAHPEADKIDYIPQRWKQAQEAVEQALEHYKISNSSGVFSDFKSVLNASKYEMINIKDYMNDVAGKNIADQYKNVSYSLNYTK